MTNYLNYVMVFLLTFGNITWSKGYVRGYYKKNGTYVAPYYRNSSNHCHSNRPAQNSANYNQSDTHSPDTNGPIYKWVDKKGVTHFSDTLGK